MLQKYYSLR